MRIVQRILIGVIVLGSLIAVFMAQGVVGKANSSIQTNFNTTSNAAASAISDFATNDATSTTVYQQQVTSLWATKDLLKVVADELSSSSNASTAIVESNLAVAKTQAATNWLLFALIAALGVIGIGIGLPAAAAKTKPIEDVAHQD